MNIFHLKPLAMTVALLASSSLCAQFSKIGGFGYLDYYIGEYQGKQLYQTLANGVGANKNTRLVAFADSTFTVEKEKKVTGSFHYLKWFVADGSLYAVTVYRGEDTVGIDLNKYDAAYEVVEKTVVFKETGLEYDPAAMRVQVSGNTVAVAGNTAKNVNGGFIAVIDLATQEHYLRQFSFGVPKDLSCADLIANPRGEVLAVFQGKEDNTTTGKQKKLQAFLVSCTRGGTSSYQLESLVADGYVRSFRFCGIDAEQVLLGGLFFSAKSRNMIGYYTATVRFGSVQPENEKRTVAASLTSAELWSAKDAKRVAANKRLSTLNFQYLKEIRRISDGSFIFVSEGRRVVSGGGGAGVQTTVGAGNASSAGGTPALSTKSSNMSTGAETIISDIVVSRVQPDGTTLWSNKTKLREFAGGAPSTSGLNAPLFVLKMDEEEGTLNVYYTEEKKKFGDTGLLNADSKKNFLISHMTIAALSLKLADGNGVIQTLHTDFDVQSSETIVPAASYRDAAGNLVLVTSKGTWEPAYRKVIVKKCVSVR